MKQTILNIGILLACMISAVLPIKANNPYVNALKLHGDVSCVKIYSQRWTTKFGEMVLDGDKAFLETTLYYDKDHRLLYEYYDYDTYDRYHYFYEYTYKDGALTTIDCYAHNKEYNDTIYGLSSRIKLTKENGITVARVYDSDGYETSKHSPYNAIESYQSGMFFLSRGFWEPSPGYFYIFAFEIKATKPISSPYNYNYNSKKQLSSMTGNKFIKFDYDDKGNITYMEIHDYPNISDDSGTIYTFEYEYGNFEEAEKFRRVNYMKRIEQEEARKDSIAAAKLQALQAREDSIANAKKQEWEQVILPSIQEFAKAIKENTPRKRKKPSVGYYDGVYTITFDDKSETKFPSIDYEYSDDSGKEYYVSYSDDLTCMIFRPIDYFDSIFSEGIKFYLVCKESSGSFKVYGY